MLDEHCGHCSGDVDKKQLAMGRKVEREHTDSPKRAERIAIDHLTEPDVEGGPKPGPKHKKYYTVLKKSGLANELVGESDGPCPHCHPEHTGRRADLASRGWKSSGFGWDSTEWLNPTGTYFVMDKVIDDLPEDEWAGILAKTDAQRPTDTPPKADIMPGGSLGTVGGTSNSGVGGIGGGL